MTINPIFCKAEHLRRFDTITSEVRSLRIKKSVVLDLYRMIGSIGLAIAVMLFLMSGLLIGAARTGSPFFGFSVLSAIALALFLVVGTTLLAFWVVGFRLEAQQKKKRESEAIDSTC